LNSKGRPLWTHPLRIHQHSISPGSDDRDGQSREARLHRKGWVGLSVGTYSDYEDARIMEYVDSLGKDVYRKRPWLDERCDERPGDIGPFASRYRFFYFSTEQQRQALVDLIEGFPQRDHEMFVTDAYKNDPHFRQAVVGLNWHVFEGEDGNLLTIPSTVGSEILMAIRIAVGCGGPNL
jgi:hypothetical protein